MNIGKYLPPPRVDNIPSISPEGARHEYRKNLYLRKGEAAYNAYMYLEALGINVREYMKSVLCLHAERLKQNEQDNAKDGLAETNEGISRRSI